MPLNETQEIFARALLAPPEMTAMPGPELIALFTAAPDILPERLAIYRSNVVGNLTDAMLATYPIIKKLTGEEFATALMRSCVLEHPPQEACLAHYGGALPAFIENFAPASGLPYLADVARLEWAVSGAYSAPDDVPLTPHDMQAVPAAGLADLNLRLRAAARLVASHWPLETIRSFCLNYDEKTSGTLDLEGGGCRLLVSRPALAVEVVALAADEYVFFEALMQEQVLGAALEATLRDFPAFDFSTVLQRHLQLKTFTGLSGRKNPS